MKYYVVYVKYYNEILTEMFGEIITFKGTKSEIIQEYMEENKIILNVIKLDE